jgi:excisionase family DNA binding protein
MDNVPSLLDRKKIAQKLGCSAGHVFEMERSGRLPAPMRIGRLVRWHPDDFTAWMNDRRQISGGNAGQVSA